YKKARAGEIKNFTGIDSAYEVPENADMTVNTTELSAEQSADAIIADLAKRGIIAPLEDD
ncbi:adenylyl-sulfate kinase, partial [Ahrensia marina]